MNKHHVPVESYLTDLSKEIFPNNEGNLPPLDRRYTYSLDISLLQILQSYLLLYLDLAEPVVDLEYFSFDINGTSYTERSAIEKMINLCDEIFKKRETCFNDNFQKPLHELFQILETVLPALWW